MEKADKERFMLRVLDLVNEKREEIKKLTSEIMELENDPKNVVRIKQDVQSVLNAVASFTNSKSTHLELVKLEADLALKYIRMFQSRKYWDVIIVQALENFCTNANAWNPIVFDFNKKGLTIDLKNLNVGININK